MSLWDDLRKAVGVAPRKFPPSKQSQNIFDQVMSNVYTGAADPKITGGLVGWSTYTNAYLKNEWLFAAIRAIIDEILAAGFVIKGIDEDEEPSDVNKKFLEDLFQRPNKHNTFSPFIDKCFTCLLVTGDMFIEVAKNMSGSPGALYYVDPSTMQWDEKQDAWVQQMSSSTFADDEILHPKIPSLRSDRWGQSPLDVIARGITLDIYATDFNRDFFKSGAHPKGILSAKPGDGSSGFDYETFLAEEKRLREQGTANPRGYMFLYGVGFEALSMSNRDMEFSELTKIIRDKIISVYGVPPHKISIIESGNLGGGTGENQDMNFKKRLRSWMILLEDEINYRLIPATGIEDCKFEFGDIDFEDKKKRAEIEDIRLKNGTLTINQVRKGYSEDDISGGDEPLVASNLVPLSRVTQAQEAANQAQNLQGDIQALMAAKQKEEEEEIPPEVLPERVKNE